MKIPIIINNIVIILRRVECYGLQLQFSIVAMINQIEEMGESKSSS